jgi:hypothetical protein
MRASSRFSLAELWPRVERVAVAVLWGAEGLRRRDNPSWIEQADYRRNNLFFFALWLFLAVNQTSSLISVGWRYLQSQRSRSERAGLPVDPSFMNLQEQMAPDQYWQLVSASVLLPLVIYAAIVRWRRLRNESRHAEQSLAAESR